MTIVHAPAQLDRRDIAYYIGPAVIFASMTPFRGGTFFIVGTIILLGGAALSLLSLALQINEFLAVLQRCFLLPLIAFAGISALWSIDTGSTVGAMVTLVAATLIGAYLSIRVDYESRLKMVINAMIGALVLSLLADLFVPQLRAVGTFQVGIFAHKNALGRASTILVLCLLLENTVLGVRRVWAVPIALFALMYAASSGAGTATIAVAILLLMLLFSYIPAATYRSLAQGYALPGLGLLAAAFIAGFLYLVSLTEERLLNLLGRSSTSNTLEVRRSLWRLVLDDVSERPALGHGYGVFEFENIQVFTGRYYAIWNARQAHNGAIDVLYQLGIVGLALLVAHTLVIGFRCSNLHPRLKATYWIYIGALLAVNVTYSAAYGLLSVFWILHILVLTTIFDADRHTKADVVS